MNPKTRFVAVDGVKVGYQVFGAGPVDLLFCHGIVSHLDLMWGDPAYARFMNRLGSFARVITFDRRGMGVSERTLSPPSLDERVRDMKAVLAAAGSTRAVVLGFSDGGMGAALFAASHPERISGLILCATAARGLADEDQPGFVRPEYLQKFADALQSWGTGRNYELFSPTLVGGQMHRQLTAVFERAAASKDTMVAIVETSMSMDIKAVLPSISVPTIVIQRTDDLVPFESGRYISEQIPGARLIAIEGADHVPFAGNANSIVRTIESFVAEVSGAQVRDDRAFQTILFADISNAKKVAGIIREGKGRVIDAVGSELLATFDGPAAALSCAVGITRLESTARVGVHSGECLVESERVVGATVHQAARIRDQAVPGQVLASDTTRTLASTGFTYRSLGACELKGIPEPVELYAAEEDAPQTSIVFNPKLSLSDRFAIGMAKLMPGQTRMIQRITNRSYARLEG